MARLVYFEACEPELRRLGERTHWVCRCGLSGNAPICDGSHGQAAKEAAGELCLYGPPRGQRLAQSTMGLSDVAEAMRKQSESP